MVSALGDLAVAHGDDALLGLGRPRARILGLDLGGRLLERLLIEGDRLLHQRRLDLLLAIDLELAQFALAPDARLVEAAVGGDARALDFLAGGDLGFLQRLGAGDFELLDRAPALEPGDFERLFAHDVGRLDFLARDDLGLLDLPIGVDALDRLAASAITRSSSAISTTFFWSMLSTSRVLDEAMRSSSSASSTSMRRALDRVAPLDLGGLDRFGAVDFEPAGFLLGADALGGDHLLLGNARGLDRFARGDLGFLDRAVARDLERANALFLGDT